jgi:hypothetical protein
MRTTLSLESLRDLQLLDEGQLARLAPSWDGRLQPLVEAGLLTRYQARQIARGRIDRLRVGPYLLLDRLGNGGQGVVYKAHHLLMDRVVALKMARRGTNKGTVEAAIAARLSHPHIVQAYDASRQRGRLVLALEYVEGVDLARLLAETGPLPFPLVETVARQTASALAYLQSRGLVHRDVKPANLILVPDADRPVVKLIDMGLTCGIGEDSLCGSPDYLAPERGLGDPADGRGDLYSLGCTLYELLTGRVPYPGGDPMGKLLRHRLEEAEPIEALRSETPVPLVQLVMRLMERDPERRLSDPGEIEALLEVPSLEVSPREPSRPRARWPWAAAIFLGLLLGGLARLGIELPAWAGSSPTPAVSQPVDLMTAFAEAPPGAVITLHEPGPYVVSALRRNTPLTVRAAPGVRPVIVRRDAHAWEPMLQTQADLTLEGIALHDEAEPPLLSVRKAGRLTLRDCSLEARRQALNVEIADAGTQRIELIDCEVCVRQREGAALLLWRGERERAATVEVELRGTTVEAGRLLAVQSVLSPVRVLESACRLRYRQDRISYVGYPDSPDDLVEWDVK